MILWQLFISFLQVGLFSIGGGYAAMPLIQSQVVEGYGWLTMSEFTDLITIAEMTPGPIAVNSATFVGTRIAGLAGALVATMGCILPAVIIIGILAHVYAKYSSGATLQTILSCLRPTVVALIASAGLSVLITALFSGGAIALANCDWLNAVLFLGAFAVLRKWKKNPIAVMASCGAISLIVKSILSAAGV